MSNAFKETRKLDDLTMDEALFAEEERLEKDNEEFATLMNLVGDDNPNGNTNDNPRAPSAYVDKCLDCWDSRLSDYLKSMMEGKNE